MKPAALEHPLAGKEGGAVIAAACHPLPLRAGTSGFTLMETLVAMTILGVALVVIFQQFSGALNAGYVSESYTRAVWHAREKMEELLLHDVLAEGTQTGDFGDGYTWRSRIESTGTFVPAKSDDVAAFTITVWVSWEQGRSTKELEVGAMTLAKLGST